LDVPLGTLKSILEQAGLKSSGAEMEYVVILEKGKGSVGAYVPDLPGCVAVGETRDEALQLIREAIELHLDGMREEGLAIPEPSSSTELVRV
jgi:predicted RNase H-like HicB family nuclease